MRPPRTALATAVVAIAAAAVVAGTAGGAQADLGIPVPTVTPLPTVSVPTLPLPTTSVPVPAPSLPGATSLPTGSLPGPGGSGSGTGSGTSGSGSSGTSAAGTAATSGGAAAPTTAAQRKKAARRQADATPMIAGTPAAADLVDDESSPQMYGASQQFLAADQAIAEIGRQKQLLAQLKQSAAETAHLYRAMGYDVAGAQQVAAAWHARLDSLAPDTAAATQRLVEDSATRADERHGGLAVSQQQVRAEFEALAAQYQVA
jgi:hypothetical protein